MRGPKPKPMELHKRDGTKPKHHAEVVVLGGRNLPDVPPDLSDEGIALWDIIIEDLSGSGVLAESDRFAVEGAVTMLQRARQARAQLGDDGPLVLQQKFSKDGELLEEKEVPHPALRVERDSWSQFLRFAEHLGLSPSARARLGLVKAVGLTAVQLLEDRLGENPLNLRPVEAELELDVESES